MMLAPEAVAYLRRLTLGLPNSKNRNEGSSPLVGLKTIFLGFCAKPKRRTSSRGMENLPAS
jgi:hypothetical protein